MRTAPHRSHQVARRHHPRLGDGPSTTAPTTLGLAALTSRLVGSLDRAREGWRWLGNPFCGPTPSEPKASQQLMGFDDKRRPSWTGAACSNAERSSAVTGGTPSPTGDLILTTTTMTTALPRLTMPTVKPSPTLPSPWSRHEEPSSGRVIPCTGRPPAEAGRTVRRRDRWGVRRAGRRVGAIPSVGLRGVPQSRRVSDDEFPPGPDPSPQRDGVDQPASTPRRHARPRSSRRHRSSWGDWRWWIMFARRHHRRHRCRVVHRRHHAVECTRDRTASPPRKHVSTGAGSSAGTVSGSYQRHARPPGRADTRRTG